MRKATGTTVTPGGDITRQGVAAPKTSIGKTGTPVTPGPTVFVCWPISAHTWAILARCVSTGPFLGHCRDVFDLHLAVLRVDGQSLTRRGPYSARERVLAPVRAPEGAQGGFLERNRVGKRPFPAHSRTNLARIWPTQTRMLQPSGCIFLPIGARGAPCQDGRHTARSVEGRGRVAMHLVSCAQCSPGVRRVRLPRADKVPQECSVSTLIRS